MYIAWLCYPYAYDEDDDEVEPTIEFREPGSWKYGKVIQIQFSVLQQWTDRDKELYT